MENKRIKVFNKSNRKRLEKLFFELSIVNDKQDGNMGANSMSANDYMQTNDIPIIKGKKNALKKLNINEFDDEWIQDAAQDQRVARNKKWIEYLNLLQGFKVYNQYLASLSEEEVELLFQPALENLLQRGVM